MDQNIRAIAKVSAGYQNRKAIDNELIGTHSLLQIRDFNKDRTQLDTDDMIRFTPPASAQGQELETDDVVFLARGQRNFAFAIPVLPVPTLASPYFWVLRPQESISGAYLSWFLNQPAAQHYFKRMATIGAHMPVVNRDVLENLRVPVPDRATQQKILELDSLAAKQSELLSDLADRQRKLAAAACLHAARQQ